MGDGRHVNSVAGNVGVRFPSDSPLAESPLENKRGVVRDTSSGPVVAQEGVVSGPPGIECRASTVIASNSKTAEAAS